MFTNQAYINSLKKGIIFRELITAMLQL